MEVRIFENLKEGVSYCVDNYKGKQCGLLFYNEQFPEPDNNSMIEFLAHEGSYDEIMNAGMGIDDRKYLLVPDGARKNITALISQLYINKALALGRDVSKVSDGYHTFDELYEFRKAYNAALFNVWSKYDTPTYDVHKSWRHHDGELCFGGGWFIVVAVLPDGQISNYYEAKDWDLFKIPEVERAKYEFDGHSSNDVIDRLLKL